MASRNITLTVDEDVLAKFRILAAEQKTSVNALVRKHMEEATGLAERRKAARERMLQLARENLARDAERAAARERGEVVQEETWRWSREDTYAERTGPGKR